MISVVSKIEATRRGKASVTRLPAHFLVWHIRTQTTQPILTLLAQGHDDAIKVANFADIINDLCAGRTQHEQIHKVATRLLKGGVYLRAAAGDGTFAVPLINSTVVTPTRIPEVQWEVAGEQMPFFEKAFRKATGVFPLRSDHFADFYVSTMMVGGEEAFLVPWNALFVDESVSSLHGMSLQRLHDAYDALEMSTIIPVIPLDPFPYTFA